MQISSSYSLRPYNQDEKVDLHRMVATEHAAATSRTGGKSGTSSASGSAEAALSFSALGSNVQLNAAQSAAVSASSNTTTGTSSTEAGSVATTNRITLGNTGLASTTEALNGTAKTLFTAQQIAAMEAKSGTGESEAVTEFRDFIGKTPAERMRAQILKGMGLTEEELAALSPEERKKVELQIARVMEESTKLSIREDGQTRQQQQITSDGPALSPTDLASAGQIDGQLNSQLANGVQATAPDIAPDIAGPGTPEARAQNSRAMESLLGDNMIS
ncbi:hypothetical protein O4H49_03560 [Kiloniella laminariae]|uniref:Uncharacterized protein n=1 Tax=Kiloniella laminariae TaxID=454162 RepID=A0ABT4LFX4_9PROT|nr:hypothetical protein [Kiloniella laminariae]MCZ4279840.1 hypothetical protein [Kiloniella laminariae]